MRNEDMTGAALRSLAAFDFTAIAHRAMRLGQALASQESASCAG
jgi:hypothetical protein